MNKGATASLPATLQHKAAETVTMSSRQRWLAALDCRPVDRLPFWPKINASYARAQEGRFREMSAGELHDFVGSDLHSGSASCLRTLRERTALEVQATEDRRVSIYRGRRGELRSIEQRDHASASWHPVGFPVKTIEDVKLLTEWYRDARVELDEQGLARAQEQRAGVEASGRGIIVTNIAISPLMEWVQHLAGIENAHYMLLDHPAEVEALLTAMGEHILEKARIIAEHHPADLVYMVENTSTSIISPDQYRRYCKPLLRQISDRLRASGKRLCLHMCGLLLDILPDIDEIGAAAWEAFTSPPVGNTRFADGRAASPDVCLIGGTNAALWTRPAAEIIAEIKRDLDALPHHRGLVVTSAGVMPPICAPETIREVRDWVARYPVKC
jgi:uroporphyrinogen-III decarboxylase